MRDDDRLLDLPTAEFGSGVVGPCDVCGIRQAVIVLSKERYRLCVIDFLNKAWLKTDKKPGSPAPVYVSERVWFPTHATSDGQAQGVVLSPTKLARHPVVLLTPDIYGITTTMLDAGIRFAREGFEVMIPDLGKIAGIGAGQHLALRGGARFRRGVPTGSKKIAGLVALYRDAFDCLLARPMVDGAKCGVFGTSYGASLALAFASGSTSLAAVALAYPAPVHPPELVNLVTAPMLIVAGDRDRTSARAISAFRAASASGTSRWRAELIPGARHGFLSRDLAAYDLSRAETAWGKVVTFLREQLMPAPPRPPAPPVRSAPPSLAPTLPATAPPFPTAPTLG